MNVLICTPIPQEAEFLHKNVQKMLIKRGLEPIIFSFPDKSGLLEYLSVSPDVPDLLFFSLSDSDSYLLDTVQNIADTYNTTRIVLIGQNSVNVERLFAIGISYYFNPPISEESFRQFEHRSVTQWFSEKEKHFILKNKKCTLNIAYSDILYVMSDKRKAIVYQPQGKTDSLYCKLDEIESELDDRFIRCHQSYLVNVQYICGIDIDGFMMIDSIFIPISQKKYWASKRRYIQYIKEQG